MSFLEKLAFWKRKDDFESVGLGDKNQSIGDVGSSDLGLGTTGNMDSNLGMPAQQQPSFQQPSTQPQYQPPQQQTSRDKDLEIISSKLDALRASLESINQRIANLEAMARGQEDQNRKGYYRY